MRLHRSAGFTLIEILVVVVIIGILAAIVTPVVFGKIDQARVTKAKSDIRTIEGALEMFRVDNYKFPTSDMGLEALVKQPSDPTIKNWQKGGYLKRLPKDPWGNDYYYVIPGTRDGDFDLYTLGADGQEGGEEADADIGNWSED